MAFSSVVFVCFFLPAVCLLNWAMPGIRSKNALLTVASLIFYGFGDPFNLVLLLASVLCNYTAGLLVTGRRRRLFLALAVAFNLGLLAFYKYLGFFAANLNALLGAQLPVPQITLPIGISFFTFQGLSYVIDVYREPDLQTSSFFDVLLYICLFPQLVAGPIVKYRDIAREIRVRRATLPETAQGLRRFVLGLSKKLLIADTMAGVADTVFGLDAAFLDIRLAWLGAVAYTLQIYFDFSGYSDMAIGMGWIFGFHFKENFDHPYASTSVKMFWRRWHISLSSWFRDYLYIPLGGNRRGRWRTYATNCWCSSAPACGTAPTGPMWSGACGTGRSWWRRTACCRCSVWAAAGAGWGGCTPCWWRWWALCSSGPPAWNRQAPSSGGCSPASPLRWRAAPPWPA